MKGLRRWLPFGGGSGSVAADGLVWDVALKAHASGDYSVAVAQANESLEDQAQVLASPSATLVGVYDGHGGPEAARFVNARLFPLIQEFAAAETAGGLPSPEAITKAFGAAEEEFMSMVLRTWPSRPRIMSVGTCCLVGALVIDTDGGGATLHVANLGDSRAVLGRRAGPGKKLVAERLSRDHNVADESVRREVAAAHPDDPHVVLNSHGVWRIKGIIQVSRSIGDAYLKRPEICRGGGSTATPQQQQPVPVCLPFLPVRRAVMSAVPSVTTRAVRAGVDRFVVFASDGLWEQLSDEAAVAVVGRGPRKGAAMRLVRAAQLEAARKKEVRYDRIRTIERGHRRQFHDDITVVVLFLDLDRCKAGDIGGTYAPVDVFTSSSNPAAGDDKEDPTRPVLR